MSKNALFTHTQLYSFFPLHRTSLPHSITYNMGKSSGKKVDQAKVEAKKARQAMKQEKVATKRNKKENAGEEDIDAIIAEFAARESARTAVSVTICPQPSPRSNFSLTLLPSGELLLFGGEFCDGQGTEIYNDVFRWNPEKNEWKHIESLNTPPPRCSHQAVCYKDKLYIFGGEYATLDQFHHYRDLWELDLKTNVWTEIKASGDAPSARSGHRMVVWRGYLVLFGGFYEAMREVRWYNDAFVYSFQDRRWALIPQKPNAQVPKPRSGVAMCMHTAEDAIYIYGGYSKEKVTGSFKEGKVHEDVWVLQLKPSLAGAAAAGGAKGGLSGLDLTRVAWQKISRKGDFPSTRCGSAIAMYKSKALLFGGVFDEEGPRHALVSTFYSDLFAFDLDRKRWYKLGLKQKKAKLSSGEKKEARRVKKATKADEDGEDGEDSSSDADNDSDDDASDNDEEVEGANSGLIDAVRADKGDFFGYIDETGNVVYINMNDEGEGEEGGMEVTDGAALTAVDGNATEDAMLVEDSALEGTVASMNNVTLSEEVRNAETLKNQLKYEKRATRLAESAVTSMASGDGSDGVDGDNNSGMLDASEIVLGLENGMGGAKAEFAGKCSSATTTSGATATAGEPVSAIARYFNELTEPCPRINPAILIRSNTLYIYGGVTELGDTSIPLDDCWSLDLNKRDTWKKVLPGSMHNMVWKGEEGGDSDDEYSRSTSRMGDDDDDYSSGDSDSDGDSESDDSDSEEDGEMEVEGSRKSKKDKEKEKEKSKSSSKKKSSSSSSKGGLRAEMEGLRAHLDTTNSDRTPLSGETLRQFYSRTADVWAAEVIAQWQAQQQVAIDAGTLNKNETLSEKEIKRLGFALSEVRYNELLPLLARLNELEEQQAEEEGPRRGGGHRGVGGHSSGGSERAASSHAPTSSGKEARSEKSGDKSGKKSGSSGKEKDRDGGKGDSKKDSKKSKDKK